MRNFKFLFLFIFLYSCGGKQNSLSIPLFNQYVFEVHPDEKQLILNKQLRDEYTKTIKETGIQIPLFKALKGEGYILFIGIPYGMNPEKLAKSDIFSKSTNSLYPDSFYRKEKIGNREIVQVISKLDKNWLSISAISQNERDKFNFNINDLLERVIKAKK